MFCPSCGQQQVSEEMKFCSRCGFPLGLVSEILSHGGFLPQLADLHQSKTWLTRGNGIKAGVGLILLGILLTPITAIIFENTRIENIIIPLVAIITFVGGFVTMLFSLLFLKSASQVFQPNSQTVNNFVSSNAALPNNQTANALPPQQSQPVNNYVPPAGNWRGTNELVQPPSVTESATKLLNKDQ